MSGQQKRGFRLPWAADERGSDEASAAATLDQGTLDSAPAAVGEELGEGPFHRAGSEPAMTADAAPAAFDAPDASAEGEMIDTDATQDRIERATEGGVWPTTDRAAATELAETPGASEAAAAPTAASVPEPEVDVASPPVADREPRSGKRENPLVAGLVKAMREAAVASRAETTTRLQAEAAARIEAIRAESTEEAATLRKRVDDDIAGIREWSKIEMARIRAETEHRIEERRADAINESQRHLDGVEELVNRVQGTVSTFESDMDRFFERLLAETDPAKLATLAEQAPEPPDLSGELPTASGWTSRTFDEPAVEPNTVDDIAPPDAEDDVPALEATAAAEAEAAATEGLDLTTAEDWPAAVTAAARRAEDDSSAAASEDTASEDAGSSRLLVSGLSSVAGISAFKGAIGGLPGVHSVSVSTGERGVFVYTVNHEPATDIAAAVAGLSAFSVQINEAGGDGISVTAHEPAA